MIDRSLYADLAPVAGPRRTPRTAHTPARPCERQHTPIGAPRNQAAQTQTLGRLAHAGGSSGKRIAFNASV